MNRYEENGIEFHAAVVDALDRIATGRELEVVDRTALAVRLSQVVVHPTSTFYDLADVAIAFCGCIPTKKLNDMEGHKRAMAEVDSPLEAIWDQLWTVIRSCSLAVETRRKAHRPASGDENLDAACKTIRDALNAAARRSGESWRAEKG